jgi:hypothetical protein
MARRTATVTITAEGRDHGKTFLLTEKPATEGEEWVAEAFFAMMAAGVDIPEDIVSAGSAGFADRMLTMGFKGLQGIPWRSAQPLYMRLMECVVVLPNPSDPSVVRAIVESDTEEVATRLKLRLEVLKLHGGFTATA